MARTKRGPYRLADTDIHGLDPKPSTDFLIHPDEFDQQLIEKFFKLVRNERPSRNEAARLRQLVVHLQREQFTFFPVLAKHYDFVQIDANGMLRFSNKPPSRLLGRHKQPIHSNEPAPIDAWARSSELHRILEAHAHGKPARKRFFKKWGQIVAASALAASLPLLAHEGAQRYVTGRLDAAREAARRSVYNDHRPITGNFPFGKVPPHLDAEWTRWKKNKRIVQNLNIPAQYAALALGATGAALASRYRFRLRPKKPRPRRSKK